MVYFSFFLIVIFFITGCFIQNYLFNDTFPIQQLDNQLLNSWSFYFLSNSVTCLIIASGLFLYGIPTIPLLSYNGFILGYTIAQIYQQDGEIWNILKSLIPHGIFEIPALILAGMIGLQGLKFYHIRKNKQYYYEIAIILIVVMVLLFVASLIEAKITPVYS